MILPFGPGVNVAALMVEIPDGFQAIVIGPVILNTSCFASPTQFPAIPNFNVAPSVPLVTPPPTHPPTLAPLTEIVGFAVAAVFGNPGFSVLNPETAEHFVPVAAPAGDAPTAIIGSSEATANNTPRDLRITEPLHVENVCIGTKRRRSVVQTLRDSGKRAPSSSRSDRGRDRHVLTRVERPFGASFEDDEGLSPVAGGTVRAGVNDTQDDVP